MSTVTNDNYKNKLWFLYICTILIIALFMEFTFLSLLIYAYINGNDVSIWLSLIPQPILALSRFFPSANNKKQKTVQSNNSYPVADIKSILDKYNHTVVIESDSDNE